jgi:hypothetical protein
MFLFRSSLGHVFVPSRNRRGAKGRAALSNAAGRFERHDTVAEDDGWDLPEDLPPLRTEVAEERPRTAITRNSSPDMVSTGRSIPTAAANMAASTVSRGRHTRIWACRRGSISKHG